jgi:hypothetical protein
MTGDNPWSGPVAAPLSVPARKGPIKQWRHSLVQPYVSTGRLPLGYGGTMPVVQARHLNPAAPAARNPAATGSGSNEFSKQLEGLWKTDEGEYLGLRDDEFLWTDGHDKYESGTITTTPDILRARTQDGSSEVTYRYRYTGDGLITLGQDGRLKAYRRVPVEQSTPARNPVDRPSDVPEAKPEAGPEAGPKDTPGQPPR